MVIRLYGEKVVPLHTKSKNEKYMKTILVVTGIVCIVGLSWIKIWFAVVGFILIGGLMCYELFAYGMSYGEQQDKILEKK